MAKLVDALDLGSSAARRGGSSPSTRTKKDCFQLAQLVEQLTVNQWVAGSSPALGAKSSICELSCVLSELEHTPRICSNGSV